MTDKEHASPSFNPDDLLNQIQDAMGTRLPDETATQLKSFMVVGKTLGDYLAKVNWASPFYISGRVFGAFALGVIDALSTKVEPEQLKQPDVPLDDQGG